MELGFSTCSMSTTATEWSWSDNASTRMTLATAGLLGVGTTSPVSAIEAAGTTGATSRIIATRYSTNALGAGFQVRKSRGTEGAPSAVLSGDILGNYSATGYNSGGSFFNQSAAVQFMAAENFTGAAGGTGIELITTATSTTTSTTKVLVAADGNVGIGTTTIESFGGGYTTLEVAGSTTANGGVFKTATSDSAGAGSAGTEMIMYTDSTAGGVISVVTSDPLQFHTGATEAMRIDASQNLLVGGTAQVWDETLLVRETTDTANLGIYNTSTAYTDSLLLLQAETAAGTGWKLIDARSAGGGNAFYINGDGGGY